MRIKKAYLIAVIAVIIALCIPMFERFTITDNKSGYIVFQDKLKKYEEFYVSFTHSVNRTPVNEYYRVSGDKLILEKSSFYSYGAGMPEVGEYGSGEPSIVNGVVQLNKINKEFEKFTYFAGTYANHSLNTDNTKIYFTQFVKPQTPVTFEIKKVSIITLLRTYWLKYRN